MQTESSQELIDFVVTGYSKLSANSTRYDYIVSAQNKMSAKAALRRMRPSLRNISATPVKDYTELNPLKVFPKLFGYM